MNQERIRNWTPRTWGEFLGGPNAAAIKRLQRAAVRREHPTPLLLIGPYGVGKTVLAEFTIKSQVCANVATDGNPCNSCRACQLELPACNRTGSPYRRYQLDGHALRQSHDELKNLLDEIVQEDDVAVFFDELHGLDRIGLEMLLTTITKFTGIFIAAIKDSEFRKLPPELFERFRKIWLRTPSADEMVTFFCNKAKSLGVQTDSATVRLMVDRTDRSFRTCLDILQAAMDDSPGVLDRSLLQEFINLDI